MSLTIRLSVSHDEENLKDIQIKIYNNCVIIFDYNGKFSYASVQCRYS